MRLSKTLIRYFANRFQRVRIEIFKNLSDNNIFILGSAKILQPVQFVGKGKISFGKNVQLGYFPSPGFYDGIIYLEARNTGSEIVFGNDIIANNKLVICCDRTKITISNNVLIGTNVEIIDSDFHSIDSVDRRSSEYLSEEVSIGENVFIGSNVKILKGVSIGNNSIIANGSLVVNSIPSDVIAGGNPAKIIRSI